MDFVLRRYEKEVVLIFQCCPDMGYYQLYYEVEDREDG